MVYVDDMCVFFGWMIMCYMVVDIEVELYEMVDWIGVARRWYQGDYYDILFSKCVFVVVYGVEEIIMVQLGWMLLVWCKVGIWWFGEMQV